MVEVRQEVTIRFVVLKSLCTRAMITVKIWRKEKLAGLTACARVTAQEIWAACKKELASIKKAHGNLVRPIQTVNQTTVRAQHAMAPINAALMAFITAGHTLVGIAKVVIITARALWVTECTSAAQTNLVSKASVLYNSR